MNRLSLALIGLCVVASSAAAQGTDTCTTPTPIAGVGTFAFSNGSATTGTQGQTQASCLFFGQMGIAKDVWFAWTAPSTNTFEIASCGLTSVDTKMAAYAGNTCPAGAALACNDDSCGLQSSINFAATIGNVYAIQVGVYPVGGTPGGNGSISAAIYTPLCSVSTGADVIVGDLQSISNYNTNGTLDAVSLGTTSCNIGTAQLGWHANTPNHPVIGGNLYRYRVVSGSGRFEQIGLSWLKHGFFAESETLCCSNCVGTDGTVLGVDCSDPYTSNRNGTQSGLGPRFQVNPHTGVFPYPPANPAFSGSVARRCQYLTADVDVTAGVRYFGEAQYVTPDDSAANNQNNNASYRELSVNGAGTDFSVIGLTQRRQSAIRAWQVVDASVVLTDVQVANDGLFVVGYRTTNLGGGQYHYEYAVYNMNSDRNGGSFSVPIPLSATITNVGFHDVTYRDGDGNANVNVSGTDWTTTQTASSITWACEAVGVNANANALRWGTTYNFRFDANAAPTIVNATMGLWKTGAPANFNVNVEGPSGPSSVVFCSGNGSDTACPCTNPGLAGRGCNNTVASGGAAIASSGVASIAADTLVMSGTFAVPFGPGLYYEGSATANLVAPFGAAFGNGLRCAGGATNRLEVRFADGVGASATTVSLSAFGAAVAGNTYYYQLWYRDTGNVGTCTPGAGFNFSSAVSQVWTP